MLYAGSIDSRLFRSADAGSTWTTSEIQPEWREDGRVVSHLTVHPDDPDVLYVGFRDDSPSVLRSTDGGRTFQDLSGPQPVLALRVGETDTLYAGSYWSVDAGQTWEAYSEVHGTQRASWVLPHDPGSVLVGGYRSIDGGRAFVTVDAPGLDDGRMFEPTDYAADPLDPSRIYAATSSGILISEDGGLSFTIRPEGLPGILEVAVDPGLPGRVYALDRGRGWELYVSDDHGLTWRPFAEPLRSLAPLEQPLGIEVVGEGHVIVRMVLARRPDGIDQRTRGRLYVTRDHGRTWTLLDSPALFRPEIDRAEAVNTSLGITWFASNRYGLYRLAAGAADWVQLAAGQPAWFGFGDRGRVLHVLEIHDDSAWTSWLRSADGGETFSAPSFPGRTWKPPTPHTTGPTVYILGEDGVYRSDDHGDSWSRRGLLSTYEVSRMWISPADADVVHTTAREDLWVVSDDGCLTWTTVREDLVLYGSGPLTEQAATPATGRASTSTTVCQVPPSTTSP